MASGLTRWFKEEWVDLSRPKKGGGYEPCGRDDAKSGKYPKCVPAARAEKMTSEEIKSAIRRKRRAESTKTREDKKPIMVETVKKVNIPADMELYNRVKAAAKAKFDVYPSAYANGWLVQEYKRRGGKYKTVSKGDFVGHPFRGNQWTKGRSSGIGLTDAAQVSVGWDGDATYESGITGFSTKGDHPDDADPNDEEGWFPAAVDARLDVVQKVLNESKRRNGDLDKSIVSHMLGLNNAAQDVFLSHLGNDMTKGAVANAVKATSGKERDIRKYSRLSTIQGARVKVKTQARKDDEIDSLTNAQYGRYSKAPQTLSHDSAMAYALNPKKFTGIFGTSSVQKGDYVGHPFRGNQWTKSRGIGLTDGMSLPGPVKRLSPNHTADNKLKVVPSKLAQADRLFLSELTGAEREKFIDQLVNEPMYMPGGSKHSAFVADMKQSKIRFEQKTQKQKDADVDSLSELEYHIYGNAPKSMSHDDAIARAKSPEGLASIQPTGKYGGSIAVGDFIPVLTKDVTVKTKYHADGQFTATPENYTEMRTQSLGFKQAKKIGALDWREVISVQSVGENYGKANSVTFSDGKVSLFDNRLKYIVWSPGGIEKGDFIGHPFRGNQWTKGRGVGLTESMGLRPNNATQIPLNFKKITANDVSLKIGDSIEILVTHHAIPVNSPKYKPPVIGTGGNIDTGNQWFRSVRGEVVGLKLGGVQVGLDRSSRDYLQKAGYPLDAYGGVSIGLHGKPVYIDLNAMRNGKPTKLRVDKKTISEKIQPTEDIGDSWRTAIRDEIAKPNTIMVATKLYTGGRDPISKKLINDMQSLPRFRMERLKESLPDGEIPIPQLTKLVEFAKTAPIKTHGIYKEPTQTRKNKEVDSLNDNEYERYSNAPEHFSHDTAVQYAVSPEAFKGHWGDNHSPSTTFVVGKVSRMSADLWSTGEGGFIGPSLGNVVALGEGRKRSDYDSFIDTRRRMVKNYKDLKPNSYQRERFQKETTGNGRSGGELGRGNNQIRASRKKKMLKEWGSGSSVPCGYCGAKLNYKTLEMEKLVPEIGYDTFENLAPACRKCNASMYSKTFVEKIRMISKDSPTTSDVHVPAIMGSRKKRDLKKKKMAMDMALRKEQPLKDPRGGLTAAGRAKFNRETGSNLKPGVKGKADTPEKMKRKGSFLTRFFTNPSGPMVNDKGEPTRLALSAAAWGEPVPKNRGDAAKLAEKGRNLLARYENTKMSKHASHNQQDHAAVKKPSSTKGKPRPTAPTKAGQPQIKTRIVSVDARSKAKAEKVRAYMETPAKRFKNPNVRKYALARIKQMTGGEPRPSGMSKKYGLDKKQVISTEAVLSKIFRTGREKFKI